MLIWCVSPDAVVSIERVAAAEVGYLYVFAQFVGQSPTESWSRFARYSTCVVNGPAGYDGRQHLALIQGLWRERQAARKDPATYRSHRGTHTA